MLTNEAVARKNLVMNLRYIMRKEGIKTQRELAELLTIVPATLTSIMGEKQTPTLYPFFHSVTQHFGYSVEEMLETIIEEEDMGISRREELPEASYKKFYGVYQMTYFDASEFKGRNHKSARDALSFGVLVIYRDRLKGKTHCVAQVALKREDCVERFKQASKLMEKSNATAQGAQYLKALQSTHTYTGQLVLSSGHVYITLDFAGKDKATLILHRPESPSPRYIGGIGGMVSISKGRSAAPCIRLIGLSRYQMDVSEEEIARKLMLGYPAITPGEEVRELIELIQAQYDPPQPQPGTLGEPALSITQKEYLLRGEILKLVRETVERNLFRGVTVSYSDDDEWYHYVKQFDRGQ